MVLYSRSDPRAVDVVFAALADPPRRAILGRLREGESSVSELAAPFNVSMTANAKHVRVLERAGLLTHRAPEMSVTGTYRKVDPPALLVYTWRWDTGPAASNEESLVTVEFHHLDDERTEVIVTHDRFPTGHDASPYRSGWEEGLDKLDIALTKGDSNA